MKRFIPPLLAAALLLIIITPAFAEPPRDDETAKLIAACLEGGDAEKEDALAALYSARRTAVPRIMEEIAAENDRDKRTRMLMLVEHINHRNNLEQDRVLGMLTDYRLKQSHFWMVLFLSLGLFFLIIDLVRRKLLRIEYSWLWVVTGVMILLLVLTRLLDVIAGVIGARVPQALFFMGVLFLTLINIHYSVAISRLTNQAKNLSQELAVLKNEVEEAETTDGPAGVPGTNE